MPAETNAESGKPMTGAEDGAACPEIITNYSDYSPPFDVAPLVARMLDSVPSKFLVGLSSVVLTNASGLPRRLRRSVTKSRRRKVRFGETRGRYHPASRGHEAWIEIFVDNVLKYWGKSWWLKLTFLMEHQISDVLFHEVGHHIHFTQRPEYREREDVADIWKVRLQKLYSQQRFPLRRALARAVKFILGPLFNMLLRKSFRYELKRGWMSRAEFEERTKGTR